MTFLELQAAVMDERFDATRYRQRVKGWLNDAYLKVRRRLELPEEEASTSLVTVVGQRGYPLPADFQRVKNVSEPGQRFLREGSLADLDEYDPLDYGPPEVYALTSAGSGTLRLQLAPTPDGAYQYELDYVARAARLSADTDVPDLDEDYHDLLVTYATAKAYRSEEDRELHDSWMQDFELELGRMKADLEDRGGDGPEQVPGMWGLDGFRG